MASFLAVPARQRHAWPCVHEVKVRICTGSQNIWWRRCRSSCHLSPWQHMLRKSTRQRSPGTAASGIRFWVGGWREKSASSVLRVQTSWNIVLVVSHSFRLLLLLWVDGSCFIYIFFVFAAGKTLGALLMLSVLAAFFLLLGWRRNCWVYMLKRDKMSTVVHGSPYVF